jgi:diguanylate cyclase (GGDEF)-like protein
LVIEIDKLSRVDPLTAIANRRAFSEQLEYTVRDVQRSGRDNAVVMLDIDYFKEYNDNRGHVEGDKFLCDVARSWTAVLRDNDLLARYGGEEFIVLLRDCELAGAVDCADRLRGAVPSGITCSAGVAVLQRGEEISQLLNRVDLALYEAKNAGRNQTAVAPEKLPPDLDVTAQRIKGDRELA